MSEMWTTSFVLSTRLRTVLGPGRCGPRCQNSTNAGGALCSATARKASPSRRYNAELGLADANRVHQHRLEHRLKLARCARNDAQHLSRCGLLLSGLRKLAAKARDLSFLTSNGGTAMARNLYGLRLSASRLGRS